MPGNSLGITLPTVGVTVGPTWASNLNTAVQAIIDDVEPKITPDELDMTAALSMRDIATATAQEITGIAAGNYDNKAATLTGAGNANKVYVVSGDLYFTNGSGSAIQLTSGGAINVGTVGGIKGDYSTDPAPPSLSFTSSNDSYTFTSGPGLPAPIITGPVEIREEAASVVNAVILNSPTSLAAAYTYEFPAALPASDSLLSVSSGGVWTHTRDPSVDTVTTTGVISVTGLAQCDGGARFAGAGAGSGTLDHFEEGSWTPTLFLGATEITGLGASYTTQTGRIQRIGDWATIHVYINWTGLAGNQTGVAATVQALPYSGETGLVQPGSVWEMDSDITVDTTICAVGVDGAGQEDRVHFYRSMDTLRSNTWNFLAATAYELRFTVTYKI